MKIRPPETVKILALSLLALAALPGCRSSSTFEYAESWLIREDPIRPFAVPSDLIYIQDELYDDMAKLQTMAHYAQTQVGNGRFNGVARVFSPLVETEADVENALKWYFRYHHSKDRPFFFLGEGRGGALLEKYETLHAEDLAKAGLAGSRYSKTPDAGFVNDELVKAVRDEIQKARYFRVRERPAPGSCTNAVRRR